MADAASADGSKKKAGQQIGDADEHRKESEGRKQKEIMLANYRDFLLKDQQSHKQEQSLIMKENVQLLQEINDLKKREHALRIGKREQEDILETMKNGGIPTRHTDMDLDIPHDEEVA